GPARLGRVRRLDGVADVLAVAVGDLAHALAVGAEHLQAVALVRPRLLAPDEELRGAVDERGLRDARGRREGHGPRGLVLLVQVLVHPLAPALAAVAALAIAAEPARGVEQVGRVDPDGARLHLARPVEREVDVLGPDAGREAVGRVVGELDRLGGRAEAHRHQHRPEDLDLSDGRRRLDSGEQRRRIEEAILRAGPRGLPQGRALLDALLHQLLDPLELDRGHYRADVDGLVERVADAQLLHARAQLLDQLVRDRLRDQQPRS